MSQYNVYVNVIIGMIMFNEYEVDTWMWCELTIITDYILHKSIATL